MCLLTFSCSALTDKGYAEANKKASCSQLFGILLDNSQTQGGVKTVRLIRSEKSAEIHYSSDKDDAETRVNFSRTNRGFKQVISWGSFPKSELSLESLNNKKVLDVGCGGGAMVNELREHGIEATGIDLLLGPEQRALADRFIEGDITKVALPKAHFDVVISNASIFTYNEIPDTVRIQALEKVFQALKAGGKAYLSPVSARNVEILRKALQGAPNVQIRTLPALGGRDGDRVFILEKR